MTHDVLVAAAKCGPEVFLRVVAVSTSGLPHGRTIMAYPRGGGSYTVANENLGVAGTTRRGVSDRAIEKLPLLER
jgi:hypothetical protein